MTPKLLERLQEVLCDCSCSLYAVAQGERVTPYIRNELMKSKRRADMALRMIEREQKGVV